MVGDSPPDLPHLSTTEPGQQRHILVEEGKDSRRLVIAFTGFQGALTMRPFDFFSVTGMLESSRILLRDPSQQLYLSGCGKEAPDFDSLLARLKREIDRLSPEWVTCIGTSSGGYAAMLFGHLLPADEVHAFAPNVRASAWSALFRGDWDSLLNEARLSHFIRQPFLPARLWRYFDLRSALQQWNGRTRFVVHFCEQNARDATRADLLPLCAIP